MNGRQNRQQWRQRISLYALLIVVRPCCSTVVFSGVVNVTVTTKIRACSWRNDVVQIEECIGQLNVDPSTVDSLKDANLRNDVPFGGIDDE